MKLKKISLLLAVVLLLSGCRNINSDISADTTANNITEPVITVAETQPPAPPPAEISLVMVGDVLLHEKVTESGKRSDGTYNYDHLFKNVKSEIENADLAIVNQEVILGGAELGISGYPCFNGPFEVGDALVSAGFDVVLHATNHALDKGKAGLLSCASFWGSKYPAVAVLGIYATKEESENIYVYEKDGIRVAILNYTYGTNGIPLPSDMPYAVNLLDENKIKSDVARAKQMSDFVVVAPHWGTEYVLTPDAKQKYWTQLFFDSGVDLVIGTHPHVVEPVEVIQNESHSMLVYYSLGNFVNSTAQTGKGIANRMLGAMAQVTISRAEDEVKIIDYGVLPLVSHVNSGEAELTTYKLSDYTEALAAENEIVKSDSAFSLDYCKTLAGQVFGDLYKN